MPLSRDLYNISIALQTVSANSASVYLQNLSFFGERLFGIDLS